MYLGTITRDSSAGQPVVDETKRIEGKERKSTAGPTILLANLLFEDRLAFRERPAGWVTRPMYGTLRKVGFIRWFVVVVIVIVAGPCFTIASNGQCASAEGSQDQPTVVLHTINTTYRTIGVQLHCFCSH